MPLLKTLKQGKSRFNNHQEKIKKYDDRGNKDKTMKSFVEIGKSQCLSPKETRLQKLSQKECFITKFKCQHGAEILGKLKILL